MFYFFESPVGPGVSNKHKRGKCVVKYELFEKIKSQINRLKQRKMRRKNKCFKRQLWQNVLFSIVIRKIFADRIFLIILQYVKITDVKLKPFLCTHIRTHINQMPIWYYFFLYVNVSSYICINFSIYVISHFNFERNTFQIII